MPGQTDTCWVPVYSTFFASPLCCLYLYHVLPWMGIRHTGSLWSLRPQPLIPLLLCCPSPWCLSFSRSLPGVFYTASSPAQLFRRTMEGSLRCTVTTLKTFHYLGPYGWTPAPPPHARPFYTAPDGDLDIPAHTALRWVCYITERVCPATSMELSSAHHQV